MIPIQFDYYAPQSIEEALTNLKGENISILAGGLSLLTDIKLHRLVPEKLVDLRLLSELKGIKRDDTDRTLVIGSMTTYGEIAASQDIKKDYAALVEAVQAIGDAQVRNQGTIGGNLACNNSASDLPPVVLIFEATITLAGPQGTRAVTAQEFLTSSFKTLRARNEIVTAINMPLLSHATGSAYEKFKNPANSYAICGIAALVHKGGHNTIDTCRVAVTGATKHTVRLRKVEKALEGQEAQSHTIAAAAQHVSDEGLTFISDLSASSDYRAHLTKVLTERALRRAANVID
jgi:carbon-monoxide dehydrogenase medium subunit